MKQNFGAAGGADEACSVIMINYIRNSIFIFSEPPFEAEHTSQK